VETRRLSASSEGLISSIGWQAMTGQSLWHYSGFAVLCQRVCQI